jgi:TonB-linked SusC/RagA family outer membrane protein
MRKLKFYFLAISIMVVGQLLAQTKQVRGIVTDSTASPLANVTVQVLNSSTATQTDASGAFSIQVPLNNPNLVISSVGYSTRQINVSNLEFVNVVLGLGGQSLQEVVVTALGITRDRRALGYATQVVRSAELVDKGEGNLLSALQGKIAGADITTASGTAGAPTNILLRGVASFTGSQSPLMVVDGIPISNDVDEATVGLYSAQSSNRAIDLNLENIESVNVLAGPAAAALYGSRAKNGAIMITTKKGSGKRNVANVTFNSSYTLQKVYGFPELQNRYGQGANGVLNPISANSLGPAFSSTPMLVNGLVVAPGTAANPQNPQIVNGRRYTAGDTILYNPFPDNINSYFNIGQVFENNLSINSGDATNYYGLTLGNTQQKGILPTSEFNRTTVGFNGSTNFTDKLTAKIGATYFSTVQRGVTQGSNGAYSSYSNVYRVPRSVDFEYYKNNYTTPGGYNNWFVPNNYSTALQDSVSASDNPYFSANRNPIRSNVSRVLGNLSLGYDFTDWLNVSYRLGVDGYTDRRKRTVALGSAQVVRSVFTGTPGSATGGIMEDVFYRNELNGDLMITAKKNDLFVQGLNANFLLGHGVNQRNYQQVNQTGYNLTVPDYYNITNATNLSLSNEYNSQTRLWGMYGQISLGYNNYLFLELTGRQDHSSTLPTNRNSYFYPSANASIVLTDAFNLNSRILSFAKLRAAYARVGNDAPVYSLRNTFETASAGNNVAFYNFPFGNVAGFEVNTALGNGAITPEFISTIDLGVNLGLFQNRLNIDATVYNSKSTDQIVRVGLPASSGFTSQLINVGSMTNKGLELTVSGAPIRGRNFTWNMRGTFSFNRNKVTELSPGVTSFALGGIPFSGLIPTVAVGEPFGIVRGSKFLTNENGERLIDSTTGLFANYVSDVTVLDPNRDWIAGLTNTLNYKNFTLSFLVDHKQGGQFESFTVFTLRQTGALKMTEDRDQPFILPGVIDMGGGKYRPNNIQINGQTYYNSALGAATGATTANEFAVVDATTFRLRELSLSYDINGTSVGTRLFKTARFTVYGRNLFFYAPNSLIDPELSTQTGLVRGLELGSAPGTRNFGGSLRFTF